jgi:twitching motility protein PilT
MGEGEGKTFYEITEANYTFGWRTFDQACLDAYEQGFISEDNALLYCSKRGPVTRGIDNIKKQRGEQTTNLTNLHMKTAEQPKKEMALPGVLKLK